MGCLKTMVACVYGTFNTCKSKMEVSSGHCKMSLGQLVELISEPVA